jgi:hypothetical protein
LLIFKQVKDRSRAELQRCIKQTGVLILLDVFDIREHAPSLAGWLADTFQGTNPGPLLKTGTPCPVETMHSDAAI